MRAGKPELLAPAGSYEGVIAAAAAGADAVYVGGGKFGARAFAKNLSGEELLAAIDDMHIHGKKLYLTVNTLLKNREMNELYDYVAPLYEQGLDGVIVQDMGALGFLGEQFPDLALHASTQMTVAGLWGINYLKKHKVKRVVLPRELSLAEISDICRNTDVEIECFVHGALCYCYSGQCLMSSMLGGRSGNRGRCAQPCRLSYEAFRDGKRLNDRKHSYVLSPRDICTLNLLPELVEAGVASLKIEGRMKRAEYTAGVVSIYRKYLDLLEERGRESFRVEKADMDVLEKLYTRSGFSEGYLKDHNGPKMMTLSKPDYITAGEEFYGQFRRLYIEEKNQEKVNGKLTLFKGKPATITLNCRGVFAQSEGAVVQTAVKQPLAKEKIESQMRKTGNTPFIFGALEIQMEPDIFLPVQELNALRREGLERLGDALLFPYRRTAGRPEGTRSEVAEARRPQKPGGEEAEACRPQKPESEEAEVRRPEEARDAKRKESRSRFLPGLTVSVETMEQLRAAARTKEVTDIYVSGGMFRGEPKAGELRKISGLCRSGGKGCYFLMPYIFRPEPACRYAPLPGELSEAGFDGIVVRNVDELGFLEAAGYAGEVRSDYTLYTMNDRAAAEIRGRVSRDTVPLELNYRELRQRDCTGSELLVYGYIPLMISAQCVEKNLGSCRKDFGKVTLKDRYQKEFQIQKDCQSCCNLIYNSTPLVLAGLEEKISGLSPKSIRMAFTREGTEETEELLRAYIRSFLYGKDPGYAFRDFTRGHFNRGVD